MRTKLEIIDRCFRNIELKHKEARAHFGRPLTLTEKILTAHMDRVCDEDGQALKRKISYANFAPDRVAMQDATAQMAILQFITAGKSTTAVPTSVHCDHLILAERGAQPDLAHAKSEHKEVFDFLRTASLKYDIDFWQPGSGIIHQVVLENYAFPGGMMVGTDSHTPNAGGLGMVAIGVGGTDAVDVMTGQPLSLQWPGVIGVKLTGQLSGWTAAKDVILKLMGILTVKGGTNSVVEFFGPGCATISATGKATIANMGAEHGATCTVFPYDEKMADYLAATGRKEWADFARIQQQYLCADPEVYAAPEKFYDRVIEIDLSTLLPHIVGPHTPDLSRPVSDMKRAVDKEGYPNVPTAALIGSCTNSSYEDISRVAYIAQWAVQNNLKTRIKLLVTPGSETVHSTIARDGQLQTLNELGAVVLANACGPCIGQWHRVDIKKGEINSIISSYNRNFPGRNDGSAATLSFLASPEMVLAVALAGNLDFDPINDFLTTDDGKKLKMPVPVGDSLPQKNFVLDIAGLLASSSAKVEVEISPLSTRLAFLERFPAWQGTDFIQLPVLLKAKGKCTTDHISPAGPWLRFRGNLDKIADNTYSGAINAFTDKAGYALNLLNPTGEPQRIPEMARALKEKHINFVVIGDENFGEGSSREHAAMQPRYLGCTVIIVKSFARIHETNLKKHGILPLRFDNPDDYNKILPFDTISILNLAAIAPGQKVQVRIHHQQKTTEDIWCVHSLSAEQIAWFKAGSALNYIANKESASL